MEYAINIKETLSRTIIVEADDLCEALQNVEDAANEGRINLTCDDSFDRDITPAEWTHEGVILMVATLIITNICIKVQV